MTEANEILAQAAVTYKERNTLYGSNYLNVGVAMKGFFPNGIKLETPNDHVRFHLFCWIVGKLTRYANQWQTGHQDSIHDVVVYAAMLEANPPNQYPSVEANRSEKEEPK